MHGTTLVPLKSEHQGCGHYLEENAQVEILRFEDEKIVIRGKGWFFTCNHAKEPTQTMVTMLVPKTAIEIGKS